MYCLSDAKFVSHSFWINIENSFIVLYDIIYIAKTIPSAKTMDLCKPIFCFIPICNSSNFLKVCNIFYVKFPFLYPMKTLENQRWNEIS